MPRRPLTLNLIPGTMWGKNVRAVVSDTIWANLRWFYGATLDPPKRFEIDFSEELLAPRRILYCSICNDERRGLELHEEWSFDDDAKVQRLDEFLAICPRCHLAKHIGRAQKSAGARRHWITFRGLTAYPRTKLSPSSTKRWQNGANVPVTNINWI